MPMTVGDLKGKTEDGITALRVRPVSLHGLQCPAAANPLGTLVSYAQFSAPPSPSLRPIVNGMLRP